MSDTRIAVFPGTFDPFTKGHEDVVRRALPIFDKIIIAMGHNSNKQRSFAMEQMHALIETAFADTKQVEVAIFKGLTAEFARQQGAKFLLRGLRNTTDFEYEHTLLQANRHVYPELETVFLITSPEFSTISSTIIRDLYRYGADVSKFLPYTL